MGNLAIIPARGGSKRIPKKNIKFFLGKPIIAYSIEAAISSGLFDEVMVSTDDEEIAIISRQYGAKVPFLRSEKNSDDYATTIEVLKEVEQSYKDNDRNFDFICCIYPTAPLVKVEKLIEGLDLIKLKDFDCVFPTVEFSYPIWRALEIVTDEIKMIWPDHATSRSQDLKRAYHDAGQWYWFNPNKIEQSLFTDRTSTIVLNEMDVQDIDTLVDWQIAEIKFKLINAK